VSQYETASGDWQVERETTCVQPDRRKGAGRLVLVRVTQHDVTGGVVKVASRSGVGG